MARLIDESWLAGQLAGAPSELAERSREFIEREPGPTTSARLAAAGRAALAAAVAAPPGRHAALDLLAADALVTLALAAAVEESPAGAGAVAAGLRRAESGAG